MAQTVKNPHAMQVTWVGKFPCSRKQLPTSVFWPGESHEMYSTWGYEELDRTERLSLFSERLRMYVVKLVVRLLTSLF